MLLVPAPKFNPSFDYFLELRRCNHGIVDDEHTPTNMPITVSGLSFLFGITNTGFIEQPTTAWHHSFKFFRIFGTEKCKNDENLENKTNFDLSCWKLTKNSLIIWFKNGMFLRLFCYLNFKNINEYFSFFAALSKLKLFRILVRQCSHYFYDFLEAQARQK